MNYNSTTNTLEIEGAVTGNTIALVGAVDGGLFIVEDTTVPNEPDDPIVDPDEPEDNPENKPCDNPWCGHATEYDINQCIQSGYFVYPCGTSSYYPPVSKPETCNCECDSYTKDQVDQMIKDVKDEMSNLDSCDITSTLDKINDTLLNLQIGGETGGGSCTCDSYTKDEIDDKIDDIKDQLGQQKPDDNMLHVLLTQEQYDVLSSAGLLDPNVLYLIYDNNTSAEQSIAISQNTATLNVGDTLLLSATVSPANTAYTWSSSNSSVCTVNSNGLITAIAAGSAIITASTTGVSKKKATCTVTVNGNLPSEPITEITIELTGTYDSSTYTFTTNGSYDPTTQTLIIQ